MALKALVETMASDRTQQLAANYQRLMNQLRDTLEAARRHPKEVTLVAVSKYVDFEATWQLAELIAGHDSTVHLGESRPQSLVEKVELGRSRPLSAPVQWHMIGHIQRNKARRVVEHCDWIHSIDSLRLLDAMGRHAHETGAAPKCLLEVNISGDTSKHGFAPNEMPSALEHLAGMQHPPRIVGMMTMAAREGGVEQAKRDFDAARQLWDELKSQSPVGDWDELSMGMSGDWQAAVTAGATMIRVGSALFAE